MLAGHTGSMPGFLCALWVSVDDDIGAVALANTTTGLAVGGLAADLVGIVAEREPRIPEPWRPLAEVDRSLLELIGPWYWGPTGYALRLEADRHLELGAMSGKGSRDARFRPADDGTWIGLNGYFAGETLRAGPRRRGPAQPPGHRLIRLHARAVRSRCADPRWRRSGWLAMSDQIPSGSNLGGESRKRR